MVRNTRCNSLAMRKSGLDRETGIQSESIVFWLNETEVVTTGDDGKIATTKSYQPVKLIAEDKRRESNHRALMEIPNVLTANWSNLDTSNQTGFLTNGGTSQTVGVRWESRGSSAPLPAARIHSDAQPKPGDSLNGRACKQFAEATTSPNLQVAQVRFDQEVTPSQAEILFSG